MSKKEPLFAGVRRTLSMPELRNRVIMSDGYLRKKAMAREMLDPVFISHVSQQTMLLANSETCRLPPFGHSSGWAGGEATTDQALQDSYSFVIPSPPVPYSTLSCHPSPLSSPLSSIDNNWSVLWFICSSSKISRVKLDTGNLTEHQVSATSSPGK